MMFRKIKKFLIWIPCMVLAFFLFSGVETLAATKGNAILLNETKVVVGEGKANTYYSYTSSRKNLTFEVTDYDWRVTKGSDTFVKWRVINPNGKSTGWHGSLTDSSVLYPDNDGKFEIADFKSLSYGEEDDPEDERGNFERDTIAPGATYFVDIQYYGNLIFSWHQKEKDETIKIIVSDAKANVDIGSKVNNKYTVTSNFDSSKTGLITKVEYFITSDSVIVDDYTDFRKEYAIHGGQSLKVTPSTSLQTTISGSSSAEKICVAVTTINGYITTTCREDAGSSSDSVTESPNGTTQQNNQTDDKGTGLFDFGFGEMILVILVIVLVVSCALIIAQKIVDHKKRLY